MEIPIELFQRLSEDDLGFIRPDKDLFKQGKEMVTVKQETRQQFETGYLAANYITKLVQYGIFKGTDIDVKALSSIKNIPAPATRLFNWNLISNQLAKLGLQLDSEMKGQIVNNADHEQIITVMLKLFYMELENSAGAGIDAAGGMDNHSNERPNGGVEATMMDERGAQHHEMSPSKMSVFKEIKPEQPINIMNLKSNKPLTKTKTTLEFVIVSLCQALQIAPNQAAGLLTDHNYYLMHACVKGVKGDSQPILKWYQLLYDTSKHLIDLAVESLPVPDADDDRRSLNDSQILEEDTQPLFVLLSALKCGFFSDDFEISGCAFKLFSKISTDLNTYGYQKVFARWYLQKPDQDNGKLGGGLEATLFMLSKHSQIAESVALLLISSFKGSFNLLIPEISENHFAGNLAKLYTLLNDLLPFLHKHHREEVIQRLLLDSNLIADLLDHAMTNKFSENAVKSASISLIAEIWTVEPHLIAENPQAYKDGSSVLDTCLKVFKNTCKFSSRSLKLSTLGLMFKLLDQFASSRDNQAPVIYKLLTFALVENCHDDDIREFMLRSFTNVFSSHKTIPVSILVEPLLRIMQLSERRFTPNCLDYTFFTTLAAHPKLTQPSLALQIMDQFARLTLSDPVWSSSAKVPLLMLAERFKGEPLIQEFLLKFCTIALTQVTSLKRQAQVPPGSASQDQQPKMRFLNVTGNQKPPGITQLRIKQADRSNMGITQVIQDPKTQQDNDIGRRIKLATIVLVVEKILQMRAPQQESEILYMPLNDHIKPVVLEASRRYFMTHGDYSKGLLQVLEFWHQFDAVKVLDEYIREKAEEDRPLEEEMVTIIRDQMSHIHEDKGRVILNELNSSYQGDILDSEMRDIDSRNGDQNNRKQQQHYDPDEFFRVMPSEDTHHSEISSQAIRNINHSQLNSQQPRELSQNGSRMLVPYVSHQQLATTPSQKPQIPINRRLNAMAQKHIEAIKNKRDEKAVKQQIDEEKKRANMEKSVLRAKETVNRRRVELGIVKGSNEQQLNEGQLVLYDGPPHADEPDSTLASSSPKRHSLPGTAPGIVDKNEGMRLIDLENEEEERERDGVRIVLGKYAKVFKFLFNKYAMSRAQHMKVENFEYFGDKSINLAEICKLMRDHDLLALATHNNSLLTHISSTNRDSSSYMQKITKEQIQVLMRLLNLKNFKRQDISALNFNHFMDFIPQIAYLACQKSQGYLSLPDMILQLIKHFEKATKAKGQSTMLYEDPDLTTIGDMEMLREMNRRVKDNPDYILPEGYYKVVEKDQNFSYHLPEYFGIPEAKKIAVETLDWLMHQAIGIHILEAVVTYDSKYKVKPRIKHKGGAAESAGAQSNPGLAFMKPIDKKQFNRDTSGLRLPNTGSNSDLKKLGVAGVTPSNGLLTPINLENKAASIKLAPKDENRPKLSASIKLEVLHASKQLPNVDAAIIQDTADVLEELMAAVEAGHKGPHLPPRQNPQAKDELKNKAQEDKEARALEAKQMNKQKEEVRKKRHDKLKEEIEKQKQDKIKQEEEQKAQKEEKDKEEQKQKRIERTMLRQKVEQKRLQVEESKSKKLEEKEAKVKQEEEKKQVEKHERTKGQKDFFKKQKEQLEQEFHKRRQEIEEAERVKKEMEELKKQQQDKVKSKMVGYIRDKKELQRNEQGEWKEIQEFYSQQEVQWVFAKCEKALGQTFKHWAVIDKKDMAVHGMQRISLTEFQKYGFQNKVVPKIVSSEDMVLIFRALVRERTSVMSQKEQDEIGLGVNSLGLEDFKKALIRIAILGQAQLAEGERLENILPNLLSQPDTVKQPSSIRVPKNVRVRGRSQINSRGSQRPQNVTQERNLSKVNSQSGLEPNPDTIENNHLDSNATPLEHERDSTPIANPSKPIGLNRKTKEHKLLEELAKVKQREENLMKVKIDDKKFNKDFDVSLVNPQTIEALIQYLNIQPNDEKRNAKKGFDPSNFMNQSRVNKDLQHPQPEIQAIDLDQIDDDGGEQYDNIIAPDGKKEDWKMAEEEEEQYQE